MVKLGKIGRRLFGAAVLGALGFGAGSLFADDAQANWPYSCNAQECNDGCVGNGAQYGYCNYHDDSCECVW